MTAKVLAVAAPIGLARHHADFTAFALAAAGDVARRGTTGPPRERACRGSIPGLSRWASICSAKPLLARLLRRQSTGALTGRDASPSNDLRSRNRLGAARCRPLGCNGCDPRRAASLIQ